MKGKFRTSALVLCLIMTALLLPGVGSVQGVEPVFPTDAYEITDWNTTDILEFDHFNMTVYNSTLQDWEIISWDLTDDDWKIEAINFLANTTVNDTLNCYLWNQTSNPYYSCATSVRNKAWDYMYPYAQDVHEEISNMLIELLLRYFDPWEPPAIPVMLYSFNASQEISPLIFNNTQNYTHEPIILKILTRTYRNFIRNIAREVEGENLPPYTQELPIMIKAIDIFESGMKDVLNMPVDEDIRVYSQNLRDKLNRTIGNLTPYHNDFEFDFWVNSLDELELNLILLRDGIVDWGLGLHLDRDFTWLLSGTVYGVVRDEAGQPLEGVTVTATLQDGSYSAGTATNSKGKYTLNLPRGDYEMTFSKDGYETVDQGSYVQPLESQESNVNMEQPDITEHDFSGWLQFALVIIIVVIIFLAIAYRYNQGERVKNFFRWFRGSEDVTED